MPALIILSIIVAQLSIRPHRFHVSKRNSENTFVMNFYPGDHSARRVLMTF